MRDNTRDVEVTGGSGGEDQSGSSRRARRPWVKPEVTQLPRLTDLTLQTGDPIGGGGGTGGGGSTVF